MLEQNFVPVKIGVIGLGRFGRLHGLTLANLPEAELVALVARRQESLIRDSQTSLRIIAEKHHGHWSARFADPSSNEAYGGADAMDAIRRLIENSPHWGVTIDDFEPDWDNCSSTRLEMVYVGVIGNTCAETPEEIRELVVKLATETGWGYTRILGELKKLGVGKITRQTVKNILKEHGFDPGPKRGKGTWDDFLKIHAETLWQCDFISKKTWTLGGLVDMYLLVIHIGSRRVWISSATAHPDSAWVAQQARNVCMEFAAEKQMPTDIIHDADTKFTKQFDEITLSAPAAVGCRRDRDLQQYPEWHGQKPLRSARASSQKVLVAPQDGFEILFGRRRDHIARHEIMRFRRKRRPAPLAVRFG